MLYFSTWGQRKKILLKHNCNTYFLKILKNSKDIFMLNMESAPKIQTKKRLYVYNHYLSIFNIDLYFNM